MLLQHLLIISGLILAYSVGFHRGETKRVRDKRKQQARVYAKMPKAVLVKKKTFYERLKTFL